MKKLIFAAGILLAMASRAHAYTEVVEVDNSTAVVRGVTCSSGTAARLDYLSTSANLLSGHSRAGIRVQNQDSTYSVWIGFASNVSSMTASGFLGEKLVAGASAPYPIGKNVSLWCIAQDGAGASGVRVSASFFGYK